MSNNQIYIGDSELASQNVSVQGQFVKIDGKKYYQIQNFNAMPDFFISIVSNSDHWMFISSSGSLSAGRKDRNNALFPYYTDDKIHDYRGKTGSISIFLVEKNQQQFLWEPFSDQSLQFYHIERNIYKNVYGNSILFEEINHDLGLRFRYEWMNSERFGFVKKSNVSNISGQTIKFRFLDGLKNILPYGANYYFQNEYSNLMDAYKKNELVQGTSLGLFMLSAIPIDRAEPSEALKTTSVWSLASFDTQILVSDKQVSQFKKGEEVFEEYDIRASRGAYFIHSQLELEKEAGEEWLTLAEVNQDSAQIADLKYFIANQTDLANIIMEDVEAGTKQLKKLVSFSDGLQKTNTDVCYVRHYTNTMFNIMRGGIFTHNYMVKAKDFQQYIGEINKLLCDEYKSWLLNIPAEIHYLDLLKKVKEFNNADLLRIVYEYLPLTFSRRHGDPSRPWNQFSIETKNEDGSIKYNYQGNWRDIFQNWEALSYSYPEFVEGIISKFLNASTFDGYNPYRIMRDGIDWEAPHPDDPWAYIGYWGDHQIIYLQKLLELSANFHPGKLDEMLSKEIFTYANVPYQIKPYAEIVKDPKDTVLFNHELDEQIKSEVDHLGADARLLKSKSGFQILKVNLAEKILATLLSKMSNFIPEAGIWLNTQRPEWNDANNALVGNGTSMVTLYHMRRFLSFWQNEFKNSKHKSISISKEMALLFKQIYHHLQNFQSELENGFSDQSRKNVIDSLGEAHSLFREEVYKNSFSGKKKDITTKDLESFCNLALRYMDQSIQKNKREDGLYHAYNLVTFYNESVSIRYLYEMLEGQVAILSSGVLNAQESLNVLNSLKNSAIYRKDQYSYMLYPNRTLPRFIEKNNIPAELIETSELLKQMLHQKDESLIKQDINGGVHFNASFSNANLLNAALDSLPSDDQALVKKEKNLILNIYEQVFDHKSFTGRSGTFYGYEGLGSIYWHMVSKLLLATQENFIAAVNQSADASLIGQLKEHYYEIKAGIGIYKSPDLYGAFPTDAYSHTPLNAGVKQPGLTGQVKEDFISRFGELGLMIKEGCIHFDASLLNHQEILEKNSLFEYINLDGEDMQIELHKDQFAYTFCQVPVVCEMSANNQIIIHYEDGQIKSENGLQIDKEQSRSIFRRSGNIKLVEVKFRKQ